VLSPTLSRLIDIRLKIGVRNSGHTMAKLLLPDGVQPDEACRLIAVTHPEFLQLMREFFLTTPANVFIMRGVEGEAVVRLHSPQPIEEMRYDGAPVTRIIGECDKDYALPPREAQATAKWTQDVLDGKAVPPTALVRQVGLIVDHCKASAVAARRRLATVAQ
jgi:anthranilate phosphoribosyltransferase